MPLLLLFLVVPLIEIALFILIGGEIGLAWTLLIVVVTAVIGATMVRTQGLRAMSDLRGSFEHLNDPTEPLAHGAMILFSGALLLTPGFFTDAIGFALLVPSVRSKVFNYLRSRVRVQRFEMGTGHGRPDPRRPRDIVIDADEIEPRENQPDIGKDGHRSRWGDH